MKRFLCPAAVALVGVLLAFQVGFSEGRRRAEDLNDGLKSEAWLAQVKRELAERNPSASSVALEKRAAARKSFEAQYDNFAAGKTTISEFSLNSLHDLREAELAVCTTEAERLDVLERLWAYAKHQERISKAKYEAGTIGPADHYPVVTTRLQFEYELVKARGK